MEPLTNEGIPLGLISPWFLHSNSTSHTSVLSAIAELIALRNLDTRKNNKEQNNAYDPEVNAEQLWIDKTKIDDQDCLIFMDNGKGMDYEKLYKMLSFGFSIKKTEGQTQSHEPVGQYGNGFKSGSMRLGKDVIVFSKKDDIMCVGLLSQTYLEKKQYVVVPIVELSKTGQTIHPKPEQADSLHAILKHSLFDTKEKLLSEFDVIDRFCTNSSGTRIIIWNLRRTFSEELEFDVMKDRYDIRISDDDVYRTREALKRQAKGDIPVPESEYSLRAYCSILYLKPRMQIILQGQKVDSLQVKDTLAELNTVTYQPNCEPHLKTVITITFGFNTKTKDHYGLMMYHKNRLIKAYERVGCQLRADNRGEGVIGVMECNHLKPTHNKQDFVYSDEYRKTIANVAKKLEEYWRDYHYAFKANRNVPEATKLSNQNRVQCNDCQKWRNLPDGIDLKKLPEKWFCHMNHDPQFRSCEAEEEPEYPVDVPPVGGQPRQLKKSKPQHSKQQKKVPQGKRQKPVAVSVQPFTSSFIQMTPQTSDDTSADKQNVILAPACKRNEKDLYLDQENPVKKKARTKEEEEEENNRSISTQLSHSTYHSGGTQEVLISDTVKHCAADNGAYSFQCSDAGQFQCKLTNLVFEMKASGNVTYKVLSWENSQLGFIGQFKPAGPLYKITSLQSSSFDLLLPHCEINTDNNQSGLAVAQFSEGNPQILQPLKITNTHVTLDVHGPSMFGLIKKPSRGQHINAQILLLYKQIVGTQMGKKLYIHLLPGNVSVKEVQKQHPGKTYIMCSKCHLTPGKKYRLWCEPCESQPKVEIFNCDYDSYYHPTFEVIHNTEDEDYVIWTLLNEFNQMVWETPADIFLQGDEFEL